MVASAFSPADCVVDLPLTVVAVHVFLAAAAAVHERRILLRGHGQAEASSFRRCQWLGGGIVLSSGCCSGTITVADVILAAEAVCFS